jgi:hypothetical protein
VLSCNNSAAEIASENVVAVQVEMSLLNVQFVVVVVEVHMGQLEAWR